MQRDDNKKSGISVNAINSLMLKANVGQCCKQLYCQFLYRIFLLKQLFGNMITVGVFTPTSLYTSQDSVKLIAKLRKDNFVCVDGFMLCASEFANVSSNWGICFTLLRTVTDFTEETLNVNVCTLSDLCQISSKRKHQLYTVTKQNSMTCWVFDFNKSNYTQIKKEDGIYVTSALNPSGALLKSNVGLQEAIGSVIWGGNIVDNNGQLVSIGSAMFTNSAAKCILFENFLKVCAAFTARKLITGQYATWVNCKDEYMIPNTTHPNYKQFEADSIVYSLFNNASNQSSLRNITYNNKQWNIKNEFFWMSRDEMRVLAQGRLDPNDINNDVEQDLIVNADDERYVYKQLQTVTLSPDAQAVLDKATDLVKKSFKYRETVARVHPEYHLQSWDAGYYQMNKLIQEIPTLTEEWKEFRALYRQLEGRMRPLVYELGFLYR